MQIMLYIFSFLIVAFGQPYWSSLASFLASTIGFALFFKALIAYPSKQRFWIATAWFTAVQWVQFSWFLSHPYLYIISVHILIAFLYGIQFGFIGWLADPQKITKCSRILLMASIWVFLEWSRLFILSGIAFNPIGLSLSANLYTLQIASIWGAFGMSFWVLWVNLWGLKAWLEWPKYRYLFLWIGCAMLPYFFGFIQIHLYDNNSPHKNFNALLVQPVFPIEENLAFKDTATYINYVESEWKQILTLTKEYVGKQIDLIALPEFVVPFATYTPIFKYEDVQKQFVEIFGEGIKNRLPTPQEPLASEYKVGKQSIWMVSNAYWLQSLSNIFQAPIISGLEDVEDFSDGHREYYSAAQYIEPVAEDGKIRTPFRRYDKRILVPMGEYIPFSFCRQLAASYGIGGSFTPGQKPVIFPAVVPFGVSICYEETFGHLIRENRVKGAQLLVNLTSDIWYPTVAQQHCDHARLRTCESGIPLLRACNTGITCGFDALGREIKTHGTTSHEKIWTPAALYIQMPIFSYPTLYSILGDYLILAISFLGTIFGLFFRSF